MIGIEPPYYATIFTSLMTGNDPEGYAAMSAEMDRLAAAQPGYLGIESARDGLGITVCYWRDLDSIAAWKRVADHALAQRMGRERWYSRYSVKIARIERAYDFEAAV